MIKQTILIIALAGSAIYLAVFGLSMASGKFTWTPDWLGLHGEPFMVLGFSVICAYQAIDKYRELARQD